MEFANIEYFLLLLLLIPYILWYFLYRKKSEPTLRMSDTYAYMYASKSWRQQLIHLPMFLRCVCFVLVVVVMARPQTHNAWDKKSVEGIDIMLAMEGSTSRLAEDLRPNRIEAAKEVAAEFISGRPDDNIGLTIFAGEAFTQCPMTADHTSLLNENDLNLVHAIKFIDQTKREDMPEEERIKPQLSKEDKQQNETRKVIKVLLWVVAAAAVALCGFVVYGVYELLR